MPLPDFEPSPEIQRVDRKRRPMKTMQLDRPIARSIPEMPALERRNSSPAEILKLTICLLYTSDAADDTPCVDL
eukprot:2683700-Amphidinium_carterae.1